MLRIISQYTRMQGTKRKSRGESPSSREKRKLRNESSTSLSPNLNKKEATCMKRDMHSASRDAGKKDSFVLKACQKSRRNHSNSNFNRKEKTCMKRASHTTLRGAGKKDSFNFKACQKSIDNHNSGNLNKMEITCTKGGSHSALRGQPSWRLTKACSNLHGSYRGTGFLNDPALLGYRQELSAIEFLKARHQAETSKLASLLETEVERRCIAEGYCYCKRVQARRRISNYLRGRDETLWREFHRRFCNPPAWQRALGVNGMKSVKDQRLRAEYHARFCAKQSQERLARSYCSLLVPVLPDCDCKEGQARMKRKLEEMARVL